MKKTYVNPEILVELLSEDTDLLNGSPNTTTPTSGLDDSLENGGNNPGNFSRRSVWDNNGDVSEEEF